ncbi:MAG: hypothetical protein C5B59_07210 [Bacteroidetes bacterium]|nr:MAG: hypothetical protein C5B59_07210 [Bacteroidota bacterium]
MSIRKLINASAVFSFIFFLISCQQPQPPEYQGFDNLQLDHLDLQQSTLSARIKFYNPNSFGMDLRKVEMSVFINENLVQHYLLATTIPIPKKDTFFLPVSLKINAQNLLSNALQSLLSNEVRIRIEGNARLKKGAIGFNVPLKYDATQRVDQLFGH